METKGWFFKQTGTAMGKQARLYMVRSTQGALYDVFFERGVAALAWPMLAERRNRVQLKCGGLSTNWLIEMQY